ncbi:hypothetical protein [Empedobacter brevis]|uniref:hypothetical protein n=1 Tax=Empedobacter brevis TaxID=247 RepID=UPI00333F7AE8
MNKQIIINGSHHRTGKTTELIKEIYPEITSLKLIDFTIEIYIMMKYIQIKISF